MVIFFKYSWAFILLMFLCSVIGAGIFIKTLIMYAFFGAYVIAGMLYVYKAFNAKSFVGLVGRLMLSVMCITQLVLMNENVMIATMNSEAGITKNHAVYAVFLSVLCISFVAYIVNFIENKVTEPVRWILLPVLILVFVSTYVVPYKIAEKSYYSDTVKSKTSNLQYIVKEDVPVYMHIVGRIEGTRTVEVYWYPMDEFRLSYEEFEKGDIVYGTGEDAQLKGERYIEVYDGKKIGYVAEEMLKK